MMIKIEFIVCTWFIQIFAKRDTASILFFIVQAKMTRILMIKLFISNKKYKIKNKRIISTLLEGC